MTTLKAANRGFESLVATLGPMARFVVSTRVEVGSHHKTQIRSRCRAL